MAAASAGSATVDETGENIYNDAMGCTSILVRVSGASGNPALVLVTGLHDTGEYIPIPIGEAIPFRYDDMGINTVFAKGNGGDADVEWGVIAKTHPIL